jgi:hypothetical protein
MQQELEARRQDIIAKERSLDQAEAAAEKRWAKLTEDVSAKVLVRAHVLPGMHSRPETQEHPVMWSQVCIYTDRLQQRKSQAGQPVLCLST